MDIIVRDGEGCEPQPQLLWDTIWIQRLDASGGYGDWILAGPGDQVESRGGLRAEAALHTATLISLFTDRRAEPDDVLPSNDGDRRGWWGDGIQIDGEPDVPLGSRLWLLERSVLNESVRQRAKDYAAEALAVLVDQGAVAKTTIDTAVDIPRGALFLIVKHYSQAGDRVYEQRFGVVWAETLRNAPMNFGDAAFAA